MIVGTIIAEDNTMDYEKIYRELCDSRKHRGITKEFGYEVHHIIPRCMGGTDDKDNLVKLTVEEHYLAHRLLVKFVNTLYKPQMQAALNLLKWSLGKKDGYNSWDHSEACENIPRTTLFKHIKLFQDNKTELISISRPKGRSKTLVNESLIRGLLKDLDVKPTKNNLYYLETLCIELTKLNAQAGSFGLFIGYIPHRLKFKKIIQSLRDKGYINVILEKKHCPIVSKCTDKMNGILSKITLPRKYGRVGYNFTSNNHLGRSYIKLGDEFKDLFFCEVSKYKFKIYPKRLWEITHYEEELQELFGLVDKLCWGANGQMVYKVVSGRIKDIYKAKAK